MYFDYDERTKELLDQLRLFIDEEVAPRQDTFHASLKVAENPWAWSASSTLDELRILARERGLWNLFLPGDRGAGLTNLQYAPLAEMTGYAGHLTIASLNCAAPDTGNMELLDRFGTDEQKSRWLKPLLEGRIRSSFAMTEPNVASSDATNICTSIKRDGDDFIINGRKWWITGAMNPQAELLIVMGKSSPDAPRHQQQSQIIVPRDTPGVKICRGMEVFGYDHREKGGHAEIVFDDVRVPATNLIGDEGQGFAIAQARLGPGRIHHCMRAIGVAERAIALMCQRAGSREAFGKSLSQQGVILDWIARSRVEVEQLRLLVLKTAWLMDTRGNRAAHTEIQAIKIATPRTVQNILDRAIQIHGAAGLCQDLSLAAAYAEVRTLRFADGPDEVHLASLGKREIVRQKAGKTNGL